MKDRSKEKNGNSQRKIKSRFKKKAKVQYPSLGRRDTPKRHEGGGKKKVSRKEELHPFATRGMSIRN